MRTSRFFLFWIFLPVLIFANPNTQSSPPLSPEDLAAREKLRRELFYKSDLRLNPNIFIQGLLQKEPHPVAIPLDGQCWKESKDFTLYLGQFYRFLVQSDEIPSYLFVQVYEEGKTVHEEKIALPQRRTPAWESYVMQDGMLFVPETKLKTQFGLDLYITFIPDPISQFSFVIAQKGADSKYQFSVFLDENQPLYKSQFTEPPPWQLGMRKEPALPGYNRPIFKKPHKTAPINVDKVSNTNCIETPNFPLLDQFVEELKRDPLLIVSYVQNEIALVDPFLKQENDIFQAPLIYRSAGTTFLEKRGSPWEQCLLLVYLLRAAGYQAVYAQGDPCSLPKTYTEKMLLIQLSSEKKQAFLKYPWVLFFDGKDWISLFPWMKEIDIHEGQDVYSLMPREYASADRWVLHYLKGDQKILKHATDGDDTAGVLFVRFVEEILREKGLSLADVGIQRNQIKKQFSSWEDFPQPTLTGTPQIIDCLHSQPALFTDIIVEIFPKENPQKKMFITVPLGVLNYPSFAIRFTVSGNNEQYLHFLYEEKDLTNPMPLLENEQIIQVSVKGNNGFYENQKQTLSIMKGTSAALCLHFGSANPIITSTFRERFTQEKRDLERISALLAFVGAAYFEKCSRSDEILSDLHKVLPRNMLAFGLAKLAPDSPNAITKGISDLKLPQVDMLWFKSSVPYKSLPIWHQEIGTADRQCEVLINVDHSSNEHQILKEIFSDLCAISTVKLLQLANQEHEKKGLPGTGFLTFNNSSLAIADQTPQTAQTLYFSHLKELDLHTVKEVSQGQWDAAKNILSGDLPLNDFAYVYMTPGLISSQKADHQEASTYREMGTLIFHPYTTFAQISNGSLVHNGGYGSPLAASLYSVPPSQWGIVSNNPTSTSFALNPFLSLPVLPNSSTPAPNSFRENKPKADVRPWYKTSLDSVADPVDIVSGAFYIDEVDLTLPGPFPLEIRRNYSSQNPLQRDLGCGWKLSLNPYLIEQDGKRYVAEQDGTIIVYRLAKGQSRWIVHPDDNPDLRNFNSRGIGGTANPFHAYIEDNVLHGTDGSKRYFDDGLLKKWINAAGNTLTFTYENNNRLSQVESSQGNFLGFHYSPEGMISEIYAKDGRRITYNYDHLGDLRRVKLPNDAIISYEYDTEHQVIKETKPNGRILVNKYIDGRVEEQSSPMGPQQSMTVTAVFAYEDGLTTVTDANGGCTIYKIFQKQIYKIIDPLGYETLQSWFIDEKSYFDPVTERVVEWNQPGGWQRSLKSSTDKRGLVTYYLYDKRGNPEVIGLHGEDLTGSGQTEIAKKLFYNDQNLCFQEEAYGQKTLITYDQTLPYLPKRIEKYSGNTRLSYTEMEYTPFGQLEKENCAGAVTLWDYDAQGFPRKKTQVTGTDDPDVVTTYEYNKQGQCIKVVSGDSIQTSEYDNMGNMYYSQVLSGSGETLLSETSIGYNQNNEPIWKHTANRQNLLHLDYHASGRIKASRQVLSPTDQLAYCLFEYDPCGYLIEEVDPLGYCTYRDYDLLGRVKRETKENHSTLFTYESGGLVDSVTSPSGAKTTCSYTTNGLLKEEIYPDGTKSSVVYDFFGRPLQETKKGITWEVTYDDANHRVIRTHSESHTKEIQEFDERGNLIRFTDAAGYAWIKTYDGLGRLKSETTPSGQQTVWNYEADIVICHRPNGEKTIDRYEGGRVTESVVFDANGQLIAKSSFLYDPQNDIQTSTQGDETIITWMNSLGFPVKVQKGDITTIYEYDACGQCIASTDGEGRTTRQQFDGLGRLILKQLPDGAILSYGYDLDSNLNECKLPNKTSWIASYDEIGRKNYEKLQTERGEISQQWKYLYANGYLTKTIDPMGRPHVYQYDKLGRLIEEEVDKWHRLYTYDPRGMLKTAEQMTQGTSGWFYTSNDSDHSLVVRTYDSDGHLETENISLNSNIIQETAQKWSPFGRSLVVNSHERDFIYQNNQLVQVSTPNVNLAYTYDVSGSLRSKISPVTMTLEYNASGLPEKVYTQLPEGLHEQTLKWDRSGKLSFYSAPGQQKTFSYKPRGQLEKAGNEAFNFDFGMQGTGVRTAAPNQYVSHGGIDSFGKIFSEMNSQGLIVTKYNPMGEMIVQGQRQFDWDPWGRLIRVTDGGLSWEASYDALGRRLQTRNKGDQGLILTTTSLYDPEEEFGELGIKYGNKTFWKFYGPNACDAVSDANGNVIYLIQNALRQLVGVMGNYGIQYSEQVPSAYGPQTDPSIPMDLLTYAQSLSWHSKSQDSTGLIWMGARYYDPKGGRFISPDPVSYPVSMDLYVYADGDPVNYFDPDGRFFSHSYQKVKPSVINVWNSPRFQGSMQALGGLAESSVGVGVTYLSFGMATPIGAAMFVHGADHFATGLHTAVSGQYQKTATSQLLQKTGMRAETAAKWDHSANFVATLGGVGLIKHASRSIGTVPQFSLPTGPATSLETLDIGREYTRSNLQLGQQMHKAYRINEVIPGQKIKEYRLLNNQKIDFLDIVNQTVYELKPYNPRAMLQGQRQLQKYVEELRKVPDFKDIDWKTVLETY